MLTNLQTTKQNNYRKSWCIKIFKISKSNPKRSFQEPEERISQNCGFPNIHGSFLRIQHILDLTQDTTAPNFRHLRNKEKTKS